MTNASRAVVAVLWLAAALLSLPSAAQAAGFDPEFVGMMLVSQRPEQPSFLLGVSGIFSYELKENMADKTVDVTVLRVRRGSNLNTQVGLLGISRFTATVVEKLLVRFYLTPEAVSRVKYRVDMSDYGMVLTFAPTTSSMAGFQLITGTHVQRGGRQQ